MALFVFGGGVTEKIWLKKTQLNLEWGLGTMSPAGTSTRQPFKKIPAHLMGGVGHPHPAFPCKPCSLPQDQTGIRFSCWLTKPADESDHLLYFLQTTMWSKMDWLDGLPCDRGADHHVCGGFEAGAGHLPAIQGQPGSVRCPGSFRTFLRRGLSFYLFRQRAKLTLGGVVSPKEGR